MFIIGTLGTGDFSACNVFATGTAALLSVTNATHSTGSLVHDGATNIVDDATVVITSGGTTETFTAGTADPTAFGFLNTGDAADDFENLASAIIADSTLVDAKRTTATTINLTARILDATAGNAIDLATNTVGITETDLGGGVDVTDEVTLNGLQYSPVSNPLPFTIVYGEFATSNDDSVDASALNNAINLDTRPSTSGDLSSTITTNTVTITTNICGTAGNAITMSATEITISGKTLSGGVD